MGSLFGAQVQFYHNIHHERKVQLYRCGEHKHNIWFICQLIRVIKEGAAGLW